jgi:ribonuclease P protein component
MFAKKSKIKSLGRLKKRSDFLWVQKISREQKLKWVAKGLIIEVAPNDSLNVRYGLTVSKKVSKSAVIRNRVKRRLKAVACEILPSYNDQNFDVVLIGRQATEERAYEDLKQDLIWCLGKLGYEKNSD